MTERENAGKETAQLPFISHCMGRETVMSSLCNNKYHTHVFKKESVLSKMNE